jgi:hypothetical protein
VAREIAKARKKYPMLGHEGLHRVLADSGIKLDEAELKAFLKRKNWKPEQGGTHIPASSVTIHTLSLGLSGTPLIGDDLGGGDNE